MDTVLDEIDHIEWRLRFRSRRLSESQGEVDEARAKRLIKEDRKRLKKLKKKLVSRE